MKKFLILSFIFFAAFSFAQTLPDGEETQQEQAQKEIATFASYKEPVKQVHFATPFDLTVNLQKQADIELPEESDFEVVNINDQDPSNIVLTLVPFNLGISTFTATLVDAQGQSFALPDLPLEIIKIKTKYDGQNLLDIRGPYIPSFWFFYLILALLIIAAIIYLVYRLQKRKQDKIVLKILNPYLDETKTPEEVALSQIDSLLLQDLWENGQYKLFYIFLTDILRDYLTARFGFEAHKFTTKDLLRYIRRRQDFKGDLINPLEVFLKSSDFVKFAKAIPTIEQRERNVGDLRFIIKETALPKPSENKAKNQTEEKTKEASK
jgi:large-conductance mechanosensitive channel